MRKATVTTDNKELNKLIRQYTTMLKKVDKQSIDVGVFADKGGNETYNAEGFTVLQNAYLQEFGETFTVGKNRSFTKNGRQFHLKEGSTINIPARYFIRVFYFQNKARKALINKMRLEFSKVRKTSDLRKFWSNIGKYSRDIMKNRFTLSAGQPANSPMTLKSKQGRTPLVSSGRLKRAITYKRNL